MQHNRIKVAFLDRDGVINEEVHYLHQIKDFKYTENCIEALKKLNTLGYKIVIVTNQAGIARGYYSEEQYRDLTAWYRTDLKEHGVEILDVLHCPHHPDGTISEFAVECECRKPKPGMLLTANQKYNINLEQSIMVGDKVSDAEAAISAGIKQVYLVKGEYVPVETDYKIFGNLYDVAGQLEE